MITHFTMAEFTHSPTAEARGIDNSVPPDLEANAERTLQLMQYIRDHLSAVSGQDTPISITSGYRGLELNAAVGGSKKSDHLIACAVDFSAPSFGTPTEICHELSKFMDDLGIGQLINEYPDRNGWVHVSVVKPAKAINRVITICARGVVAGIQDG